MRVLLLLTILFCWMFFEFSGPAKVSVSEDRYRPPHGCANWREVVPIEGRTAWITLALSEYCSFSDEPDMDKVTTKLRYASLIRPLSHSQILLQGLRERHLDLPKFLDLYEDSMEWAEREKAKSAEELYKTARNLPDHLSDLHTDFFKEKYLSLAVHKGHEDAKEDLAAVRKKIDDRIMYYRKNHGIRDEILSKNY